jgi:hypothetical protein
MRDESSADGNSVAEPGRPYLRIGLTLLALLLGLLGGADIVDRQLRPRVEVQPAAVVARGQASPSVAAERQPSPAPAEPGAARVTAAETPAADPRLLQEIEDAYRNYWEVYSAALFNLDTSRLGEVAADEELQRMRDEVEDFRRRGRAVRAIVTHTHLVLDVTASEAKVYDEIRDSSFLVDSVTKQPPEGPDPRHLVKDIFYLNKVEGTWKVVKHLRQEG